MEAPDSVGPVGSWGESASHASFPWGGRAVGCGGARRHASTKCPWLSAVQLLVTRRRVFPQREASSGRLGWRRSRSRRAPPPAASRGQGGATARVRAGRPWFRAASHHRPIQNVQTVQTARKVSGTSHEGARGARFRRDSRIRSRSLRKPAFPTRRQLSRRRAIQIGSLGP